MTFKGIGRKFLGNYSKSVATLFSGSFLSQLFPILLMPVLTRLYSPQEFGIFATYMSVSYILAIIFSFKFDVAQVHESSDEKSELLFKISLILASLSFLFCLLLIMLFNVITHKYTSKSNVFPINTLFFMAIIAFLLSINNSCYLNLNKRASYRLMSYGRLLGSFIYVSSALFLGFYYDFENKLLISFLASQVIVLLFMFIKLDITLSKFNFKSAFKIARKHIDYPRYALLSGVCNMGVNQLPIFILGTSFAPSLAGAYYLVDKTLHSPISLLGGAVGAVFREKAQKDFELEGNFSNIYKETTNNLALIGGILFFIVMIFGDFIYSKFFGSKWELAGSFSQVLAPMFFAKMVVSPVMSSIYVSKKLRVDFWGQFIYLIIVSTFILISIKFENVKILVFGMSSSGMIFYTFFYFYTKSCSEVISIKGGV